MRPDAKKGVVSDIRNLWPSNVVLSACESNPEVAKRVQPIGMRAVL